jgi:hypothetical protein
MLVGLHVSTHHQAPKAQIHTVNEQCIVGSPTLTIYRVNNNEKDLNFCVFPVPGEACLDYPCHQKLVKTSRL